MDRKDELGRKKTGSTRCVAVDNAYPDLVEL